MDGGPSRVTRVDEAADLPAAAGAYALVLELVRPLAVTLPGRPPVDLEPGWYLYAGSANGPGGIRARVGRHLRGGKTVRWHVDRLTNSAGVAAVAAFPGGSECAVAAALRQSGAPVPAPGFGSTDCRQCPSHLLSLPDDFDADDLDGNLPLAAMARGEPVVTWRRPPVLCYLKPPG
ncbi:MAG: GIY-YIG nuclease family protein [Hyphomicrobiales bacterium]|nr:GIY-YIG nuclease family protein [Hyphomicrobiales bacterium]MCP5373347.1 GIY-YIG nuclease family protein [Hyphomicrobiales bacterium]